MAGNITEEQFKKFCKDFVEKYEGKNFKELIRSLGGDWNCFDGIITKDLKFATKWDNGLMFCETINGKILFFHHVTGNCVFFDVYKYSDFYTIEDLYKFFKMNEIIEITLEVNLEDILKAYKEDISKKLGLSSEKIKINIKRG